MISLKQYWKNLLKQLNLNNLYTIAKISEKITGKIEGDPSLQIHGVCDLMNGKPNNIAHVVSEKYVPYIDNTQATALVINKSIIINNKEKTFIRVENPALSFIKIILMFSPKKQKLIGIHENAMIDNEAKLGENVYIGPYAVIEKGVKISKILLIY